METLSFESILNSSIKTGFLLKPVFLHGISFSLHLVMFLSLFFSWSCQNLRRFRSEGKNQRSVKSSKIVHRKKILIACVSVSSFNFFLMCSFMSYYFSWSESALFPVLDFSVKTFSWGTLALYYYYYVYSHFPSSKHPLLVRLWWGIYFCVSLYCLVIHVILFKRRVITVQPLLSDLVSVVTSSLCLVYLETLEMNDSLLGEPLLKKKKGDESVTPYSKAGFLSCLTFSWIEPLIAHGYKKTLDLEDLPRLAPEDTASVISPMVMSLIESDQKPMSSIKLARVVFSLLRGEILWMAVLLIASKIASYAGPYLIDGFFQYLNGKKGFENKGFSLASAFIAAKLVECLSQLQWFFVARKIRVKACASLVSLIYDKSLVLSSGSKNGKSSGEIINLMTVDTERIADFAFFVHDPWTVILEIGLATAILYRSLGLAAAITTLVSTVLITLANLPLGKLQERFQKKLMESKDSRMRAISEILKNMRILKLQGWEMKFLSRILEQRKIETSWLKKFLYSKAITSFVFKISPAIVSVVAFGTCVILDIPLDSGKVLSALATFKILQGPINKLPDTISMIAQTKVSFERISTFLRLRELPLDLGFRISEGSYSDIAVEISNGNFSWDENPTLKDVNLRVIHGSKVAICGSVGSGKSSLLSAMLGEIPRISGYVEIFGRKAYVAQSPWIQSGTIEENVLFGSEMEREKYERVLNACSLKKDLESFSFGDRTVIGERGINLSGGQKQRVQIARALYQDAEIYLFDDPFSAVDAHTGSHLFKECLMGLLSSKTVIYVTHQVEFLPSADLILVMKDGQISQAGKYKEILESETDFIKLVGAHMEALSSLDSIGERDHSPITNKEQKKTIQNKKQEDITTEPKGQLVREEERQRGRVGSSVYRKYISTVYKGALVPLILLSQVMFQAFQIASNYWMASASPAAGDSSLPGGGVESSRLVLVYTALSMGSSVFVLSRTTLLVTAGYKTATRLFNDMHRCIFRAPMSFFDSTPSARILNRASTDQSTLDLSIFFQVGSFAFCVIQLLGIVAVMSQAAWQVFVVFFPVIAACIWYQQYYLPCARELSRLIGICKAPVIQHFAETISGVVTIRGFDQGPRFRHTNMNLTDLSSRPKFHYAAAMEWLCFRLDMLSVTTFAFSLFFLISVPKGFINPGIAGLVITYGLNLNSLQAHLIWTLCNIENKIISVERILQYTTISSEPPLTVESNWPDHSWPLHGEVEIRDLQVRYALHLPLVLRGITCTFGGGTKTGIVGRTGSGKSTLIQTLFRIIDPDFGRIVIDGIDISSIGLHDLRSRLSIIPQDPTMFEGTVRSNLDPLEEYTDEQIWEVLDKCQLGDEVRKKEEKLYSSVTENGDNWSMGQRQLVCLGRVLLKKSKVLVLDEATASVDTATDNLIQQTLRQHFSHSTVITIAHRITSVIDSDMVLLLSHGVIEEHDSPERLLQNKSSSFSQLVAEYTLRSNRNFSETSA